MIILDSVCRLSCADYLNSTCHCELGNEPEKTNKQQTSKLNAHFKFGLSIQYSIQIEFVTELLERMKKG